MNEKKISTKNLILLITDIVFINLSRILSIILRYGGVIPKTCQKYNYITIITYTGIKVAIMYMFGNYSTVWEYASIYELLRIVSSVFVSNLLGLIYVFNRDLLICPYIFVNRFILDIIFLGGSRFLFRLFYKYKKEKNIKLSKKKDTTLIIGAGAAGVMMLREIKSNEKFKTCVIGFIDDDKSKVEKYINGIKVIGTREDIKWVCEKYHVNTIIFAIPSIDTKNKREILNIAKETNSNIKIMPSISEIINSKANPMEIRDIKIEDLLGRQEVKLNLEEVISYIKNENVLVTGGGGSIGSELCRQISRYYPNKLVILDIYENNAYEIQNELLRINPNLDLRVYIASIRDEERVYEIMERENINIVFHAAAHKHVPLMEFNPNEAIKNNVFGTLNLVKAADKNNISRFINISTDKAVNPTNIMGASKRIGEKIMQAYNEKSKTEYVSVRFGNVLGSNGSVIPLFKKQIEKGGPVTVTDKNINRFFMTIPEACQLVLQAGSMAKGGEVFVLDMGEPVKIINLAEDLIKLSGFEPYIEIPIKIIGLRPGEKLYEEILIDEENMYKTDNEKIYIEKPKTFDYSAFKDNLCLLKDVVETNDLEKLYYTVKKIVPSYMKKDF